MKATQFFDNIHRKLGINLSDELTMSLKAYIECKDFIYEEKKYEEIITPSDGVIGLYELVINGFSVLIQISPSLLQALTGALLNRSEISPRQEGPLTITETFIGRKIIAMVCDDYSNIFEETAVKKEASSFKEIYSFYNDSNILRVAYTVKLETQNIGQLIINYTQSELIKLENGST